MMIMMSITMSMMMLMALHVVGVGVKMLLPHQQHDRNKKQYNCNYMLNC